MASIERNHAHAGPQLNVKPRGASRRKHCDARVSAMYADYCNGLSLSEVGKKFGRSRQAVYSVFCVRGFGLRTKVFLQPVIFNGRKYTLKPDGYFRATEGNRSQLHRDMWEFHVGPIPDGWDVHHKDENKQNNTLENFECLPKADHTRIHNPIRPTPIKFCAHCGEQLVRKVRRPNGEIETPFALSKRNFCNTQCAYDWRKGKPKGARCG